MGREARLPLAPPIRDCDHWHELNVNGSPTV